MSFRLSIKASPGDWGGQERDFRDIVQVAARSVQKTFQTHFTRLSMEKSSAWWGDASRAVKTTQTGDQSALVEVDYPGVALHYYGGVVEPVESTLLAVPNNPQAKGRSPLEFSNLRLVIFPHLCGPSGHLAGMLVPQGQTVGKRQPGKQFAKVKQTAKRLEPFYWLMTETHHRPDSGALPTDQDFDQGLNQTLKGYEVEVER